MILNDLRIELETILAAARKREFHPVGMRNGGVIEIKGKTLLDFAHWDFIGLRENRDIKRALQTQVEERGISGGSPRTVSGTTRQHLSAEKRLAEYLGYDSSIIVPTKTHAILSFVTALANERDIFFVDELLQGPVGDAAYLVNAAVENFRDLTSLEIALQRNTNARRKFIVTESLSPVTGNLVDLSALVILARRYDASLIVDESYALGAIGARGAGGGEMLAAALREPIPGIVFLIYADLSLGLGVFGGAIVAPKIVTDLILQRSANVATETPLPSGFVAAIETAVNTIELAPLVREKIVGLSTKLKNGLNLSSLITPLDASTPVVCLSFTKLSRAHEMVQALFAKGIFAEALPRGTPFNESGVVRFVITKHHTERHIEELLKALGETYSRVES